MSYVKTFYDWTPIPREDGVKWVIARLREAAALSGPWIDVEDFPLADYPEADAPPAFNFTSDEVTILDGWFQFVWIDPAGNTSTSEPERAGGSGGAAPTVSEIRAMSQFVRITYPATPYSSQVEQDVSDARVAAIGIIESLTCRTLDAAVPAELVDIARRAVVTKTEQLLQAFTIRARKSAFGLRALKGFSAGPYSETYFTPDEAAKVQRLDPDPLIHELLWALATEECREKWLGIWTGNFAPAVGVQEVHWRSRDFRGY